MNWNNARLNASLRLVLICSLLTLAVLSLTACATPPSVAPLLRAGGAAAEEEARLLEADQARDREFLSQARAALTEGFEADLRAQPQLDAAWVMGSVEVYVAACETLVRHETGLLAERRQRADNLRAAAAAQQRALQVLEQQDQLLTGDDRLNLWKLLSPSTSPTSLRSLSDGH
jgi:hypothetical protein